MSKSFFASLFDMNKILKILIISDILMFSGLGFVGPILAIFIHDNLKGGSIAAAGIASAIFLISHAILQILFAYIFNPKDRLWMLRLGTFLMFLVPIGYIFSTHIWHIFAAQFVYGVGAAFGYPSWSSFFTSNLEKGRRGLQYAVYNSSVSIGSAMTAAVGATLAQFFGFKIVFGIVAVFLFAGFLMLFKLERKEVMKKI